MIITLKKGAPQQEIDKIIHEFESKGLAVSMIQGTDYNVFGVVGDTTIIDDRIVSANKYVENVTRIAAPYKKANRLFHPEDTVVNCGGVGGSPSPDPDLEGLRTFHSEVMGMIGGGENA